jgi:hypothetical protein
MDIIASWVAIRSQLRRSCFAIKLQYPKCFSLIHSGMPAESGITL